MTALRPHPRLQVDEGVLAQIRKLRSTKDPFMSASLFKAIRIQERVMARLNVDFFNVLNMPGTNLTGAPTGIILNQLSQNEGRNVQVTLRLQW